MIEVVKALVRRNEKYLMLKRAPFVKQFPDHWDFPGGTCEEGEDRKACVEREIMEETNQTSKALSTGGGFVSTNAGLPLEYHTVTLSGVNELLSASQSGLVTLVSPMRVNSGPSISGRSPGAAWMDLQFVPEPGTMLLLLSGAVGLAIMGGRRMRQ